MVANTTGSVRAESGGTHLPLPCQPVHAEGAEAKAVGDFTDSTSLGPEQKGPGAEAAPAVDFTDATCDGSGNNAVSDLEDVAIVRPEHNGEQAKGRAVQDLEDSASVGPEHHSAGAIVESKHEQRDDREGEAMVGPTTAAATGSVRADLQASGNVGPENHGAAVVVESKHEQRDDREETRAAKKKKARETDPEQREVRPRFSDSMDFWRVPDFCRAAKVFFWQTTSHPRSHATAILAPSSLC